MLLHSVEMSGPQAFFDCPWSSKLLKNLLQDTSSAEMSPVLTKPSLTRKLAILPSRYLDHPSKCQSLKETDSTKTKTDSRVHAAERAILKPHSEEWVPIDFTRTIDGDLFVSPVRKPTMAEGAYAACSYSIISETTTHLLFINPTNRPVKIAQGEIIATAEPFKPNTRCSYFGTPALLSSILGLSTVPISTYNRPITGNPLSTSVSLSEPQPQHKIGQKMVGAPDITPDIMPDITADPMSHLD